MGPNSQPNSQPQSAFEQAEAELKNEHKQTVEKNIARTALRAFEEAPADQHDVNGVPVPPLNQFFTAEQLFREPNSSEAAPREPLDHIPSLADYDESLSSLFNDTPKDAKEAMQRLIQHNAASAARVYFDSKRATSNYDLMLRLATDEARRANPNSHRGARNSATDRIMDHLDNLATTRVQLETATPESYDVIHGYELRDHIQEIQQGGIATTPYVKAHLDRLERNMATGQPTFIHGHLGSGKTELAIMAAKRSAVNAAAYEEALKDYNHYSEQSPDASQEDRRAMLGRSYRQHQATLNRALQRGDKEAVEQFTPLIISGSKDTTTQDLFTDKTLKLVKFNGKSILEHKDAVDAEVAKWQAEHDEELSQLSDDERAAKLSKAADDILNLYITKHQAFGTEVDTIKQALYRGAEEGRPVIIDEVNAIPTAVLISLNDLLQRRPGQTCYIPGAKEPITIAPGFSITMTGNLSTGAINYGGTDDLNPAFTSRLDTFEHDYLPMSGDDPSYEDQANPAKNELFHTMIFYLADRQGNLQLPEMEKSLDQLFSLAQLAHATQLIFSDKWRESNFLSSNSGDDVEARLETTVLSIRNLLNVLDKWETGKEMDLNQALWESYISGITNANDQNLVLDLARRYNFFSEQDGWQVQTKTVGAGFTSLAEIHPGPFYHQRQDFETYSLSEVVEVLYGPRPQRNTYPDDLGLELDRLAATVNDEPTEEDYYEAEAKLQEVSDAIRALEILGEKCGCQNLSAEASPDANANHPEEYF